MRNTPTMTGNAHSGECSQLERITPESGHFFYGYYDLPAWDSSGQRHLAHRVTFIDRIPKPEDATELGFVTTGDTSFHPVATTNAWNFQQGSMLQWHPQEPNQILFNQREGQQFKGVIHDLHKNQTIRLPAPIANVDPLGRYALSVNFSRMFDFRPGYGYAGTPDPFASQTQPNADGIWRMELPDGPCRLILSLAELGDICRPYFGQQKLLVNHLNLNPSGTRFVALVRHFPDKPGAPLRTIAITANADGSRPFILWDGGVASHYHWRDDTTLSMVIRTPQGAITLAEFRDEQPGYTLVDPAFFLDDGHQSYSPDRQWLLYDSYPQDEKRSLYLYDLRQKIGHRLATVKSHSINTPVRLETRCDLHPRWHPDGRRLSFDSVHEGFRGIYRLNLQHLQASANHND
ncbi:hypothetical protein H5P28_13085 [Ruficoccus amylovorans]|uniref:Oligogalacturonate lyase domain-containing protein n=1 Tax=Ruficoccus amylovorans TaxID=1804625 RepID=A0A842HF06_9BACT|nr:hypothetical protein [Ruficoccus amylovorans]MBC2595195.1 hypothetical protein [Ruficoccus amylovorans]